MKRFISPINLVYFGLLSLVANAYILIELSLWSLLFIVPSLIFLNLYAGTISSETKSLRLRVCHHGGVLLGAFALSLLVSVTYHAILAIFVYKSNIDLFIKSTEWCVGVSELVFWNGMLCVYATSKQMGVKWRIVGAICGMVPIVNLIALGIIVDIVMDEIEYSIELEHIAENGEGERCKTKYPILFVHGVFFRDSKHINYWGRIPRSLKARGATVYYGEHQSALAVSDSGHELAARIRYILDRYGCEKVNIIAHSKGGLDCRYAISEYGIAPYVASLTTINTPHRGCLFAERLLSLASARFKRYVSTAYNVTLRDLGDEDPDFMAAVTDLTAAECKARNEKLTLPDGIYTQSVGSVIRKWHSGQFPLNLSYHYVKKYDGPNDGLVGESSFSWGEKYTLISVEGEHGVSHGDVVDLTRSNVKGFDVLEFYSALVEDLKARGL